MPTPERRTHLYKVVEGRSIEADVLGAEPGKRKPCVLWIHGGGLIFGSRTASPRPTFAQGLLDCGFVVVSIGHRLAPEAKLPAIMDDVRDAWHWLHQRGAGLFGIDPARMAIAGASAGGYLSLLAGTVFAPRPRGLVSFWGYGDITAAWEAWPSDFYRTMALVDRKDAVTRLHDQPGPGARALADRSLFHLYCQQPRRWLQVVTGRDPLTDGVWLAPPCPLRTAHCAASTQPTRPRCGSTVPTIPTCRMQSRKRWRSGWLPSA